MLALSREVNMRISALGQAYLRFAAARGQSPRTAEAYSGTYQQFVAYVLAQHFDDDVRAFTPDIVEGFATMLQERGLKASTIATMLAALQSMGTYGVKTKASGRYILDANPLDRVYRPKRVRPAEKYLGKDELLTLLAVACEPAERLVLELLVDTALRATELATATVGQLRAVGERVVLTVRVKGGRHREITLGAEVAGRLLASLRLREARPEDRLLVTAAGAQFSRSTLSDLVLRLARKAGITRVKVRAHVLRHSVATLASELGVDVPAVAAMLNHSDIHTVQKYIHRNSAADEAREKVRRLLGL
jgi:integrase/recombinase XerD